MWPISGRGLRSRPAFSGVRLAPREGAVARSRLILPCIKFHANHRKGSSAPRRTTSVPLYRPWTKLTLILQERKYEENIVRSVVCIAKSPNTIVKGLDYLNWRGSLVERRAVSCCVPSSKFLLFTAMSIFPVKTCRCAAAAHAAAQAQQLSLGRTHRPTD